MKTFGPLPVTAEQMEYVDLVHGKGTAQRAIDRGLFRIVPNVHGLFADDEDRAPCKA